MATKQTEIEGMPDYSPLGKAAIEYIELKDKVQVGKNALAEKEKELIKLFCQEGKRSVKVLGRTITYRHSEDDKIVISKERE